MNEMTIGQLACETVSGPDGWIVCKDIPGLTDMWEKAARAVADRCLRVAIDHGADTECIQALAAIK
jgi:hypothetical protein